MTPCITDEEVRLASRIIEPATQYGRYGYRRITAMLKNEGWQVNHKRVERIWRKEGLKVPLKQPKREKGDISANNHGIGGNVFGTWNRSPL